MHTQKHGVIQEVVKHISGKEEARSSLKAVCEDCCGNVCSNPAFASKHLGSGQQNKCDSPILVPK